ncbi:hypothetical protein BDZ89DRAFT_273656 [Hymenopellis radicata]|nr:hypothetical protein BDZ89DRAFT_273656 [Hymenopellis radicata]
MDLRAGRRRGRIQPKKRCTFICLLYSNVHLDMFTTPVLRRRALLQLVPSSRAILPFLPLHVVSLPCCCTTGWASTVCVMCVVHVATPCAIARGSAAGTKRHSELDPKRFWRVTRTRTAGPGKSRVRVGVPTEIPSGHPRYSLSVPMAPSRVHPGISRNAS